MAMKLELVRRDDFVSDVDALSLLGYSAGFELADEGWAPVVPVASQDRVQEALTLRAKGTSHDNLAAVLQALDAKAEQVEWYRHGAERYGVWLRAQLRNETAARQALVTGFRRGQVPLSGYAVDNAALIPSLGLALERTAYWEATAAVVYDEAAGINTVGGQFDYTGAVGSPGAVVGDVAARLAAVMFSGVNGGGGPLRKFWMGFRTDRFGDQANFQSTWSLALGSAFDGDTTFGTTNADSDAKNGYKTITTFSFDATLKRRATVTVEDVTANEQDQRGTFTVLLRAKLSAAGTVRARLADGVYRVLSSPFAVRSRVVIESTDWQYYEMGTVQIPSPGRLVAATSLMKDYALGIDAERISGSCELHMDCLVLIPTAEGFVSAEISGGTGGVGYSAGDTRPLYIQHRPDGQSDSVWLSDSRVQLIGVPRLSGGLPVGDGTLILAAQRAASSVLTDTLNVSLSVYPRWATLRGAE